MTRAVRLMPATRLLTIADTASRRLGAMTPRKRAGIPFPLIAAFILSAVLLAGVIAGMFIGKAIANSNATVLQAEALKR